MLPSVLKPPAPRPPSPVSRRHVASYFPEKLGAISEHVLVSTDISPSLLLPLPLPFWSALSSCWSELVSPCAHRIPAAPTDVSLLAGPFPQACKHASVSLIFKTTAKLKSPLLAYTSHWQRFLTPLVLFFVIGGGVLGGRMGIVWDPFGNGEADVFFSAQCF